MDLNAFISDRFAIHFFPVGRVHVFLMDGLLGAWDYRNHPWGRYAYRFFP